jgi:DNA repair exonuclease SbcCD ATPase subunit
MPFEILSPSDTAVERYRDESGRDNPGAPQLPLLEQNEAGSFDVSPLGRRKTSLADIQNHIGHLSGQLETLRRQLRDHPADRLAMLLREMIGEREHELERWVAQEQRWDERLAAIETAITERDTYRRREAELTRERDDARREAELAIQRIEAAQRAAEDARRRAQALERAADRAQAEQLRLRQERELDHNHWLNERRKLAAKAQDKPWFARLMGTK